MDFQFFIFRSCIKAQFSADQSIQINALLQRPLKSLNFENLPISESVQVKPFEYLRVVTEHLEHFVELYLKYLEVDIIKALKQMFNLL